MEYDLIKLQDSMRKVQKPKRYLHSLGVQYTSANLAMRYGADIMKAQVAGILHDAAKYYQDNDMIDQCEKYGLIISDIERQQPYLLHGKLGASIVQHDFGIMDQEILGAIAYHTTGKPAMSLLEKIVFLADYIEPSRKIIPGLAQIRELAFIDLDQAVYMALQNTIEYVRETNRTLDTTTLDTFEYYKKK